MKKLTKRRLIDFCIFEACFLTLYFAGAGFWALLVLPLGLWNYYDGMTRLQISITETETTKELA